MRITLWASFFFVFSAFSCGFPQKSHAETPVIQEQTVDAALVQGAGEITGDERLSLAKEFLKRMKRGLSRSQKNQGINAQKTVKQQNILPEGELLLFEVYLPKRLRLDNAIIAQVRNGEIVLPLKDFVTLLEFPVTVDEAAGTASGWFIRENNLFNLSLSDNIVTSKGQEFPLSDNVFVENEELIVPLAGLEQWFDMDINAVVSALQLYINPSETLPMQERRDRRKKKVAGNTIPDPSLPLGSEDYQLIDAPFVNVATTSRYRKDGQSKRTTNQNAMNIRTTGDFAYGTLTTQTLIDDEDQLKNVRVNYKRESSEPDLLGPLKAKRYELGDVTRTRLPLGGTIQQELGARITNVDPLRPFTNPTTAVSGNVFPGWDVELYRGSQFLGFQEVGDDGFYNFEDVILFNNENVFTLKFYGPQGELREETLSIPVDQNRVAEAKGVYDVSVSLNDKITYNKNPANDEDSDTVNFAAFYEKPIFGTTAASVGVRSGQQNGERNTVLHGGISSVFKQILLNANAAIDDDADMAAELIARRNIGDHDLINTMTWYADNYDTNSAGDDTEGFFSNAFRANGPIPFDLGRNPRYLASFNFSDTSSGDQSTQTTLGMSTGWKNFTLNDQWTYGTSSDAADTLNNLTNITGVFGKNRVRLTGDYQVKPERKLNRVVASLNHRFDRDLNLELDVERRVDPSLTEASAQLNWQAGWARISPSISYNSDNDIFAGLNTNFGLAREPQRGDIHAFDRQITSNGGISAFVFLDENGDGIFNPDEKPLENVQVRALQNGGREETNENGIAFFTRVRELALTDVYVQEESLEDPYWVSGFDGISVLPREGYVAEVQFPIHIAGEIDGTLYLRRDGSEEATALRGIPMHLYNADGEVEQTAITDIGGFYLFTRVPPGRYLLTADHEVAKTSKFTRPKPQQIEIGYDGTIIYGYDVFVDAGDNDVSSTILANLEDYEGLHPHIDFSAADYDVALNLGEYNSRLLMSTVWYRLHTRYRGMLAGGQLVVLPGLSYADTKTGKHTLRVGYKGLSIDDAYERCRALKARDIACEVEIFPAGSKKIAMGSKSAG